MNHRKRAEFEQATRDAEQLLDKLAFVPNGHYARIRVGSGEEIVIVYSSKTQLVNGSTTVSRFARSDAADAPSSYLTKAHQPEDLGTYSDFVEAHKTTWQLVLKAKACPDAGLPMIRAIDYLYRNAIGETEQDVETGLDRLFSNPSGMTDCLKATYNC